MPARAATGLFIGQRVASTNEPSQDLEQGPPSYFTVMEEGLPTYKEAALENPLEDIGRADGGVWQAQMWRIPYYWGKLKHGNFPDFEVLFYRWRLQSPRI